jgi:hypothetical protein
MQEKIAISNCNCFEHVAKFKQFGMTVTTPSCNQEESKCGLNSTDASYHSFQILMSFLLIFKTSKIVTLKSITLLIVLCSCETLCLTWREERGLRVYENTLKNTYGLEMEDVTGGCKKIQDKFNDFFYSSPDICKVIKWRRKWRGGRVTRRSGKINAWKLLVRKY